MTPHFVVILPQDDPDGAAAYGIVGLAARLGHVVAVLVGHDPPDGSVAFGHGADAVIRLSHPALITPAQTDQLVALVAGLISGMADGAAVFLLPAGRVGEELCARLAAAAQGVALGRCLSIDVADGEIIARRSTHGGRAVLRLVTSGFPCFLAIRPHDTDTPTPKPPTTARDCRPDMALPPTDHIERLPATAEEAGLDGARIVVAGGRGIGAEAGFAQLRTLALRLGGAMGGSLPTIDAGWLPVARQIGQSGRFVAPEIYVAVAISGTPQHMAGIATRSTIVAINRDPDAAIFRDATIGVVADWREFIPALIARMET